MNVLLTHGYFIRDDEKEQAIMRPYPPLGLLYVAAWLREKGHHVRVHDSTFSDRSMLLHEILNHPPDMLAIYVNLMTRRSVVQLIGALRNAPETRTLPIMLGGPETRYHAEEFLMHGADVCVIGEGESTAEEVIDAIGRLGVHGLHAVPGIAFKAGDGTVVHTEERTRLRELKELPMPARDLIDMQAYLSAWRARHGHSVLSVSTMRGCPYTCKWCSRAVYGLSYRRQPAELVVDELAQLMERYSPDRFWFVDDVFTISHKWSLAFAEALEARGLRIAYECITRADRMNDEVIALLSRSGCVQVWIGAESGSQRIIDAMDRRVDVKQVRTMIQASKAAGMRTGTFIMLGYPGERRVDIEQTIDHLKRSDPDDLTITLTYPIKGTDLHSEIADKRTTHPDWATSSDRDVDFKRTYPRSYYTHAVRYVSNAVKVDRAWRDGRFVPAMMHWTKAKAARAIMGLYPEK